MVRHSALCEMTNHTNLSRRLDLELFHQFIKLGFHIAGLMRALRAVENGVELGGRGG
jgi:hypothetical protein